jgi:hypothetical protein
MSDMAPDLKFHWFLPTQGDGRRLIEGELGVEEESAPVVVSAT